MSDCCGGAERRSSTPDCVRPNATSVAVDRRGLRMPNVRRRPPTANGNSVVVQNTGMFVGRSRKVHPFRQMRSCPDRPASAVFERFAVRILAVRRNRVS